MKAKDVRFKIKIHNSEFNLVLLISLGDIWLLYNSFKKYTVLIKENCFYLKLFQFFFSITLDPYPDLDLDPQHWFGHICIEAHQCCGFKYIEFGSGSRILAQFGSGSRVKLSILKEYEIFSTVFSLIVQDF